MTLPPFRLRWVESEDLKVRYKQFLLEAMQAAHVSTARNSDSQDGTESSTSETEEGFFKFPHDSSTGDAHVSSEMDMYLSDKSRQACITIFLAFFCVQFHN